MLLSNRHNFLFVHIAKTGGTSVRVALKKLSRRDGFFIPTFVCHRISALCQHRIGTKLPRHAAAITAREMLPRDIFDGLFKFAFVRNPWDRLVSAHFHFVRERQDVLQAINVKTFDEFARWLVSEGQFYRGARCTLVDVFRRPQFEHLVDHDGVGLVDFVGRYERLASDFGKVADRLGVARMDLPHKRRAQRRPDYRTHYTDSLAELIGNYYRNDVTKFGFAFDRPSPGEHSECQDQPCRSFAVMNQN